MTQVHEPGTWSNENTTADMQENWYAISTDDGIVAYASTEEQAWKIKEAL
jgi:hypothetical protein